MSETEPGYYKGDVVLTKTDEKDRTQRFSFTFSDVGTPESQLVIRHKERIFIDISGPLQSDNEALQNLSYAQCELLNLIAEGFINTIRRIRAEGGAGRGADEAAHLWAHVIGGGFSSEILAEHSYTVDVEEPNDHFYVEQLFDL